MIDKSKNLIYKFLRKSQKFTGTDNVYVAKYGSYLTMGNIISIAAAFLLSIAFARLLPKETFGEYRYILSIMTLLAVSALQGMNQAVAQATARGVEGMFLKGFKTKMKWSLLGSFSSLLLSVYFLTKGNLDFTVSFLIVAIFLPLFKSCELYKFFLDGKKLFGLRVTYATIIQVLATLFLVTALFFTKELIILVLTYFLSYSILRFLFFVITIKKVKPNKSNDSKSLIYGKHLSLMSVITLISQELDKILLFHFIGPIKLAIYSFAIFPIQHLRTPLQHIQELAYPKLTNKSGKEIKKTLPKKLLKMTFLILVGIIIYIIIAPYFFKVFYPQYIESVFYSRLLAFTLLVFPMSMMALSLEAKMKTKELYKINTIQPIIQIILIVVLTPIYGILGVIIAKLLAIVFYFFLARTLFKHL